jgi:hypothetical protein
MFGHMVRRGCISVSVGVAPAVHSAAVLPPTMSAAAAAFRTSTRESGVVKPVTLSIVVTGILGTVARGLAVPPLVVAASPPSEPAAAWAVAATQTPAAASPFLPAFTPRGSDKNSLILDAFFSPSLLLRPVFLTGGRHRRHSLAAVCLSRYAQ